MWQGLLRISLPSKVDDGINDARLAKQWELPFQVRVLENTNDNDTPFFFQIVRFLTYDYNVNSSPLFQLNLPLIC